MEFKEGDRVWYAGGKLFSFKGTFIRLEGSDAVLVPERGGIVRVEIENVLPVELRQVTPWIGD